MPGIKDRVAIIGVGCTKFGEHWEKDQEDLLVEAAYEALEDAGIGREDIEAIWVGINYDFTGHSGGTAVEHLKLFGRPATRVENFCASGMDAFRNACFAVAAGVYNIVMACGVEKILDQGMRGVPPEGYHPVFQQTGTAPAQFALFASRAFHEWGWTKEDLACVAVKNHKNGALHPKARFRRPVTIEEVLSAPLIAWPLGRLDCCAVSDGAAAVIITRPEIAKDTKHRDDHVLLKASALAVSYTEPFYQPNYNWLGFPATQAAAHAAYLEAGIRDPRTEIDFAEVHDCFTSTELFTIGDLGLIDDPKDAPHFVRDGLADIEGEIPINPSGGLKCFGHPIGATGCRMIYEVTKQIQGRADGYQVRNARLGLAHNLGGPGSIASITILSVPD